MKPIVIASFDDDENYIPFTLPSGDTVRLLRMDYLDEDTFDAMNAALEAMDVEEQVIAVAHDIIEASPGAKLQWQPLLDEARTALLDAGVTIKRVATKDGRTDEVCAPTQRVVNAVAELATRKPLPLRKRGREIALTMLKFVVSEEEFAQFEKMRLGQLELVLSEWRKYSKVSSGE